MGASERKKLNPTSLISIDQSQGRCQAFGAKKNPFCLLPLYSWEGNEEACKKRKGKEREEKKGKKERNTKCRDLHSRWVYFTPMPPADLGRVRALCEAALPASLPPSPLLRLLQWQQPRRCLVRSWLRNIPGGKPLAKNSPPRRLSLPHPLPSALLLQPMLSAGEASNPGVIIPLVFIYLMVSVRV